MEMKQVEMLKDEEITRNTGEACYWIYCNNALCNRLEGVIVMDKVFNHEKMIIFSINVDSKP
jgi:hypothetical protein